MNGNYIKEKYPNVKVFELTKTLPNLKNTELEDICMICRENTNTTLSCNHYVHSKCINSWFDKSKANKCPYCQQLVNFISLGTELNWSEISKKSILSEEFIREFKDSVDWITISDYQTLSEEFIREFKDRVNWIYICCSQKLSEEFIREFKDSVDWIDISFRQTLSEEFIREFKDSVDWNNIFITQTLSKEFRLEFKDKNNVVIFDDCIINQDWSIQKAFFTSGRRRNCTRRNTNPPRKVYKRIPK